MSVIACLSAGLKPIKKQSEGGKVNWRKCFFLMASSWPRPPQTQRAHTHTHRCECEVLFIPAMYTFINYIYIYQSVLQELRRSELLEKTLGKWTRGTGDVWSKNVLLDKCCSVTLNYLDQESGSFIFCFRDVTIIDYPSMITARERNVIIIR